jgi:large subunit ribosomal protein L7/L12
MKEIAVSKNGLDADDARAGLMVLGAVVDDTLYAPAQLEVLAKLPPLDVVQGQILGQIQGPGAQVVSSIGRPGMSLSQLLHRHAHPDEAAAMAEAAAGAVGVGAAPAAKVEEKTSFDVKLDAFDAASKLKLIKEVRGLVDGLGLKEAKALVEQAPVMVKEGLTKDEAETLKAKLEAVGGTVLLE